MNKDAAKYIELCAGVRYWEDATLNGIADEEGAIPFRKGEYWCPVINLDTGKVEDWPDGTEAKIHYKVCDDGEYWLLDEAKKRFAKWSGYYVPDDILCVGTSGFGDYIIFNVGADGQIENWRKPKIEENEWEEHPTI